MRNDNNNDNNLQQPLINGSAAVTPLITNIEEKLTLLKTKMKDISDNSSLNHYSIQFNFALPHFSVIACLTILAFYGANENFGHSFKNVDTKKRILAGTIIAASSLVSSIYGGYKNATGLFTKFQANLTKLEETKFNFEEKSEDQLQSIDGNLAKLIDKDNAVITKKLPEVFSLNTWFLAQNTLFVMVTSFITMFAYSSMWYKAYSPSTQPEEDRSYIGYITASVWCAMAAFLAYYGQASTKLFTTMNTKVDTLFSLLPSSNSTQSSVVSIPTEKRLSGGDNNNLYNDMTMLPSATPAQT